MKDIDSDFRFRTTDRPGGKDLDVFVDNKKRTVWLRRGMSRTEALRAAFASGAVVQKLRQQPKPAPESVNVFWRERVFLKQDGELSEHKYVFDPSDGHMIIREDLTDEEKFNAGFVAGWTQAHESREIETE
jgi:hypothetical protein